MRLAFTGTRRGCTADQLKAIDRWFETQRFTADDLFKITATHGCCVGADIQFHHTCIQQGVRHFDLWPSNRDSNRSEMCIHVLDKYNARFVIHPFDEPLSRNEDIIRGADFLLACPRQSEEVRRSSGTWSTIRLARKYGVPMEILFP